MKIRQIFSVNPLLLLSLVFVLASSCKKDEEEPSIVIPPIGKTTASFNSDVSYGSMTDQDGNVYKTVTIGTQTWMAENLRTTKYNDGTDIPNVTAVDWKPVVTGAYCNHNNTTDVDTIATFGRLYNWHAVNTGRLAPEGWHVPTENEWNTLIAYLGGSDFAGGKLKEIGLTHWSSPNTGATNESGFTALPGSSRNLREFNPIGNYTIWWTATEAYSTTAYEKKVRWSDNEVKSNNSIKELGLSVRCVKN